ncbi:hypothetical protein ACTA71_006095 [Dictyostelium dimigraforme]
MKVLLFLVFLVFTICYGQNVEPYIALKMYNTDSTNSSNCNQLSFPIGFAIKQGVCAFLKDFSNLPTSYNVSSDSSSITEFSYTDDDFYCEKGSITTLTFESGSCNEGDIKVGSSFYFEFSSSNSTLPAPFGSLLTIKSHSENCARDWESTWQEVSYRALDTCIIDPSSESSYKLSCPNGGSQGLTIQHFTDKACSSNPYSANYPLEKDNCDGYQLCI